MLALLVCLTVPEFSQANGGIRQCCVPPLRLRLAKRGQSHSHRLVRRFQAASVQRGWH